MNVKMQNFSLYLDAELMELVKKESEKKGRSMSWYVNKILQEKFNVSDDKQEQ